MSENSFPENFFRRQDENDDNHFYNAARKVVHIDDGAIQALQAFFSKTLPENGVYLDLMSSWRSHLPDTLNPAKVIGLGMNDEEMADNPQLDEYRVHNLNVTPELPFEDTVFEAAFCTVSVQYMTQPLAVFQSVARVLKPGAPFILSFSNRCFPTKAIAGWVYTDDHQHVSLVNRYFENSSGWEEPTLDFFHTQQDPLYVVTARKGYKT